MHIQHVGIIYNGDTSQAEINLHHAEAIGSALVSYKVAYYNISDPKQMKQLIDAKLSGKLDIVFNNSAGKRGGDGSVEGLLNILNIPYVGSGMLSTAISFDKKTTKNIVRSANVPIIEDITVSRKSWENDSQIILDQVAEKIGYPVVVKASGGSDSIGTSFVKDAKTLTPALKRAFKEDDGSVLIEKYIDRLTETTCMVYGNDLEMEAFTPLEFVFKAKIMDNAAKAKGKFVTQEYTENATTIKQMKRYALASHRALRCQDYSRTDFVIDKSGKVYFLEINPHAGLGFTSPTVYSAKLTHGWDYNQLINNILKLAINRLRKP